MPRKLTVSVIGPGRLGTALALSLLRAGYKISEIGTRSRARARIGRIAPVVTPDHALTADVVWFCVPDSQISSAAREWSQNTNWKGKVALHASGALTSKELNILRKRGAAVAAVHPLMTFVARSIPSLKGVPFGMEGDHKATQVARRIVQDLGGEAFTVSPRHKAAYHAWGSFTSPLLVAMLLTAEQVARKAGITKLSARKKMLPIIRQTLDNYAKLGPAGAFSGPIIRGDAGTIRKHLKAFGGLPEARGVYIALIRAALRNLPSANRKGLQLLLDKSEVGES